MPNFIRCRAKTLLKLFDTSNLGLLRSVILSDTSTIPPLVTVDSVHNKAYLTQNGITIVEATTLDEVRDLLTKLAAQYLVQRHWSDKACRFDVVLVQGKSSDQGRIEHLQNAFDVGE